MTNDTPQQYAIVHSAFIQQHYQELCRLAQKQYGNAGRGFLVVNVGEQKVSIHYVGPDQVTGETLQTVNSYDPNAEFLLAIEDQMYCLPLTLTKASSPHTKQEDEQVEPIFNLFVFVNDGLIAEVGATCHRMNGTDAAKTAFLQQRVNVDWQTTKRYPLPAHFKMVSSGTQLPGISYEMFLALIQADKHLELFEAAFQEFDASDSPLFCITPIVDGVPKMEVMVNTIVGS